MTSSRIALVVLLLVGCAHPSPPAASTPTRAPRSPASEHADDAGAVADTESGWVPSPREHTLPAQEVTAHTYFRRTDETRSGTFRATFESMLDARDSVTGTFQVAQFRYVYGASLEGGHLEPSHDESITTLLLDCRQNLSGTTSIVYKRAGQVVGQYERPLAEVSMDQLSMPSTVTELCAFLATR